MSEPTGDPAATWESLASLVPHSENYRQNDATIPEVAASVRRLAWGRPLVARASDRLIIAGHAQRGAALLLIAWWSKTPEADRGRWSADAVRVATRGEVPVRFVDVTDDEARLMLIADNAIAEHLTENDEARLGQLLARLTAAGVNVLEGTGFAEREVDALIREASIDPDIGGSDPGAGELPAEPVSQLGMVYQLGPHRLMCGDSTNPEHVQQLMAGERALLMATDPPYLVDYDGANHPQSADRERAGHDNNKSWDAYIDPKTSVEFFAGFIRVALAHALIDSPAIYQWHAARRQVLVEQGWQLNGLLVHQQIIWVKDRAVLTRSHFMWQHEPCLYGWVEGRPPRWRPPVGGEHTTVWPISQLGEQDGIHPTQKPVEVFARPISYHTSPGDLVYEPFGGSGTQIIAAAQAGRRCYAMELSPAFVDVIRRRWTGFARSAGIDPGAGALE